MLVSFQVRAEVASCETSVIRGAEGAYRSARESCEIEWQAAKCDELFVGAPKELTDLKRQCQAEPASLMAKGSDVFTGCVFDGAFGVVSDTVKAVAAVPGEVWTYLANSSANRLQFFESCVQSVDCKRVLFERAQGRAPTAQEEHAVIARWQAPAALLSVWEKGEQRAVLQQRAQSLRRSQAALNQDTGSGAPGPTEAQGLTAVWSSVQGFLQKQNQKYQCLSTRAATELVCYGFFSVFDPAMAAGYLAKSARLARLLRTSAAVENVADLPRAARAEQVLGRALSPPERSAVERAHQIGVGQTGLDGTPAGYNNWTPAQTREKYRTLRESGMSSDEARALMERGVVGQPSMAGNRVQNELLARRGAALPPSFSEDERRLFREALMLAAGPARNTRRVGEGRVSFSEIDAAVRAQYRSVKVSRIAKTDGKVEVTYRVIDLLGVTRQVHVNVNVTEGAYYFTIIENGNTYYRVGTSGTPSQPTFFLTPCARITDPRCHPAVAP